MLNRWVTCAAAVMLLLVPASAWHGSARATGDPPAFRRWRAALIEEAVGRGFAHRLVDDLLGHLEPLPEVLQLDRMQAQGPSNLDTYLSERVTPDVVAHGREMMTRYSPVLEQIERDFGVQGRFLVAIWGAESAYGRYTGDVPVLQALATLAWDRRRSSYFRGELFGALTILRDGHVAPGQMSGSWAGAMGQPQFMPSSYLQYAVDFDHDGRRDIWHSASDVLASIANYLHRYGWEAGTGWGADVAVPPDVRALVEEDVGRRTTGCGAIRALSDARSLHEWAARGVRAADSSELPLDRTAARLVFVDSRAFLVSANYEAILAYNCSHRYALSVSMLADRLS